MTVKKNVRAFAFSNAELLSVARLLKQYVVRDAKEFASYGYTKDATKRFQTLLTAFELTPTDLEL